MKKSLLMSVATLCVGVATMMVSCVEKYDLDNLDDNDIEISTSVAAPLLKTSATLCNIFDLESIKGHFTITDSQRAHIEDKLGAERADYVIDSDGKVNLSRLDGKDLEKLSDLEVVKDPEKEKISFTATDFVKCNELKKNFGNSKGVSVVDTLIVDLVISNNCSFDFNLDLAFAKGDANNYISIPGTDRNVVIPKNTPENLYRLKEYVNMEDIFAISDGFVFGYSMDSKDDKVLFRADDKLEFKVKVYIKGTVAPDKF